MIREFSKDVQIMPIKTCLSADANSDTVSEVVDCAGFNRCCIVYHAGPQHNSSTVAIKLQGANAATNETTLTSGTDIADSAQSVAGTADGQVFVWEFQPHYRYYQVDINKDGTNATNESIVAYLYNADESPVTHAAGGTGAGTGTGAVNTPVRLGLAIAGTA